MITRKRFRKFRVRMNVKRGYLAIKYGSKLIVLSADYDLKSGASFFELAIRELKYELVDKSVRVQIFKYYAGSYLDKSGGVFLAEKLVDYIFAGPILRDDLIWLLKLVQEFLISALK